MEIAASYDFATGSELIGLVELVTGGTIAGSGELLVSGTLAWTGGAQSGSGVTRIAPGGTLERSGTGNALSLDARTLRIEGTGLVTSTNVTAISASSGARIEVASGGILDLRSSSDIAGGAAAGSSSSQEAPLTKTQVGNPAVGIELENAGTVSAAAGSLELTGGDGTRARAAASGGRAAGSSASPAARSTSTRAAHSPTLSQSRAEP